ncbi:MAG: hypothetical protein NTU85_02465 [Candidatus Kaiserbacteria bacterium]|nr:hypothetical protein [Candidatus Kaiserbacteria bacterium]
MITLSNGHEFEFMVASGALAFDGKGWPWERPLVWFGLIEPELFTIVTKTLTRHERKGNYRWWKPLECFRPIKGGAVNKVGLSNPGIEWWCREIAPKIDFDDNIVVSIYGTKEELVEMSEMLNDFDLVAIEVNPSCPNTGHGMPTTEEVVDSVKSVRIISQHPIIVKVSFAQHYLIIADELKGIAEAMSFNSVPWEIVFPNKRSPLWRLEKKVGGGGGGVSGKPAQSYNWQAVWELAEQRSLPAIAPSVMNYADVLNVRKLGAKAVSFGAIHFWTPWAPTAIVRAEKEEL